jgi:hypothetical protein
MFAYLQVSVLVYTTILRIVRIQIILILTNRIRNVRKEKTNIITTSGMKVQTNFDRYHELILLIMHKKIKRKKI